MNRDNSLFPINREDSFFLVLVAMMLIASFVMRKWRVSTRVNSPDNDRASA